MPAGVAGFVLTGLLASAMSTLDSSINAVAATVATEFYKRLWVRERDARHYANVGKLISLVFSIFMITMACSIYYARASERLDDLQRTLLSVLSGGLLGLFLLGFVTRRVDCRAALLAILVTAFSIIVWLCIDSGIVDGLFPDLRGALPDKYWLSTFANLLMFGVGYGASLLIGRRSDRDLSGLTVWSTPAGDKP